MDYQDDFIETATGLWSLEKLKAGQAIIDKAVADKKKLPKVILLPAKPKVENKKYESKRIHLV